MFSDKTYLRLRKQRKTIMANRDFKNFLYAYESVLLTKDLSQEHWMSIKL